MNDARLKIFTKNSVQYALCVDDELLQIVTKVSDTVVGKYWRDTILNGLHVNSKFKFNLFLIDLF